VNLRQVLRNKLLVTFTSEFDEPRSAGIALSSKLVIEYEFDKLSLPLSNLKIHSPILANPPIQLTMIFDNIKLSKLFMIVSILIIM
jgi:hypothetical protein